MSMGLVFLATLLLGMCGVWVARRGRRNVVATGWAIRLPSKQQRMKAGWVLFGVMCVGGLVLPHLVHAQSSQIVTSNISTQLTAYINSILSDSSNDVNVWSKDVFLMLSVVMIFVEVVVFINKGVDMLRLLEALIWWAVGSAMMLGYVAFCNGVWGIGTALSNGYQQALVGNTNDFFMVQWIVQSAAAVHPESTDVFDSINIYFQVGAWFIMVFLLQAVGWLVGLWAQFGNVLSQVIGLVFVPFIVIEFTRQMFWDWFKLFLGFVILNVTLKVTMVCACIVAKACFVSLGVTWSGNWGTPAQAVVVNKDNFYMLGDTAALFFIAILFVIGSFWYAGKLSNGAGSVGGHMEGAVSSGAGMIARKLAIGI